MSRESSSISASCKSNVETLDGPYSDKKTSLLVHSHGKDVLKEYIRIKTDGLSQYEENLAQKLFNQLKKESREKETVISTAIRNVLAEHWEEGTTTGEKQESVEGESQNMNLKGDPDVVLRIKTDTNKTARVAKDDEQKKDEEKKNAVLANVFEISVDHNGGEKKHFQAYKYCRFLKDRGETNLFLTVHFDREHEGRHLAITQECFFYKHDEDSGEGKCGKGKFGFLWREFYHGKGEEKIENALLEACRGIVRSIHCSTFLLKLPRPTCSWKTLHDNVAVSGESKDNKHYDWVYKVFDNRLWPTQRNPHNWLNKPWTEHLEVVEYLKYEEGDGVLQYLGRPLDKGALDAKEKGINNPSPPKKRKTSTSSVERREKLEMMKPMPYGEGSILIIRYKYKHGTHIASKVSHLRDIAESIQQMHKKGIVHGDIRGYNMLHPFNDSEGAKGGNDAAPTAPLNGSITKSCLLDFDLAGKDREDKYPFGLNEVVPENLRERKARARDVMKIEDDWVEFGSAIGVYLWKSEKVEEYSKLAGKYRRQDFDKNNPLKIIDDFVAEHGEIAIFLQDAMKECFDEGKGTGSPQVNVKPRQRMSASATSNTSDAKSMK